MMRTLSRLEQPEKLHYGLQNAALVTDLDSDPEEEAVGVGVPHGVEHAAVIARNVRLSREGGHTRLFFCDSYGYRAQVSTLQGGDENDYPNLDNTRIEFQTQLPEEDGYYDVLMDVSVNGALNAAVKEFHGVSASEPVAIVAH